MPAYLIAICEVTNPNENFKEYAKRSGQLVAKHGGKYLARGPAARIVQGDAFDGKLIIVNEFPTMDDFNAFYADEEYQNEVLPLREGTGNYDIAVFESAAPPPAG